MPPHEPRAINVFFTPPPPPRVADRALIVIDTLRASTAILSLLRVGAEAVYACASADEARALAATMPGARLCGERGGRRVDGFGFGNSPVEFAALDLSGQTLVQSTSNGTRALRLARSARLTLVGCLRNRAAAIAAALAPPHNVALVCAGEREASAPSLEDAFTAGAMVAVALQAAGAEALHIEGGARIALRLYHAYDGDAAAVLAESAHAAHLRRLGFGADLAFAAAIDVESLVPRATAEGAERVVVRAPSAALG